MSKTILTVDDSRTMRDMLAMALNDAGFNVVQAVDGEDGLAVLDAHSADVDVIVTDINMPKLDGFGFIEGVRKDLRHRTTPDPGADHGKRWLQEGPGPPGRGHGLDRQAVQPRQADRRHSSRSRLILPEKASRRGSSRSN